MNSTYRGKVFFLFLLLFTASAISAQKKDSVPPLGQQWTLEQCISYAWSHNIQVKQAAISRQLAKNNISESKANLLPSLTGFASQTYNYGLVVNPFTNTFANSEVTADDFALSGSFTIFGGFQNLNTIKQNQASYQASDYDLQSNKNTLALNIASDYLQVLLNNELLQEAKDQQEVTAQQVEKTQQMVNAGSLPRGNLYDVQAQEANDEVNIVNAQNQLDLSILSLAQLLDIDSVQNFKIAQPEVSIPDNPVLNQPDLIYSEALTNQPDIKSAQLKWESAQYSESVSAGDLYPKLSLTGSVGTGYSTANLTQTSTIDTIHTSVPGVNLFYPSYAEGGIIPFGQQLQNNRNESFGFRLTIPILNGLQSNIAYQNAKLNEQNAYYTYQTSLLTLRKNVQQAYADAWGALKKYHATQKSVSSYKEAYDYTRVKFDAGIATSLDYNTAKTNLEKAESDMLQAKYTYVFKLKVLDYYEGKPLKL